MSVSPPRSSLEDLVIRGRRAAQTAQERLSKLGVGEGGSFSYDQTTTRLTFTRRDAGAPFLTAEASILGSFSRSTGSWLWAWANDSILEQASRAAREVLALGRAQHIDELTRPAIMGDEAGVERLVMASFAALDPAGYYKVPSAAGFTVLILHAIEEAKGTAEVACSIILTTTNETKSPYALKDKNRTIIEERLTTALQEADLGFSLTVRLSVGLFPASSPWAKAKGKKRTRAWVASSRFLVLEEHIDDTVYRKCAPLERMAMVKRCLLEAVEGSSKARRLPEGLDVLRLQGALREAIEELPLLT